MFVPINNAVWLVGPHAPWRMSDAAVDIMLDLFEREGEAFLFNELYEAQRKALGSDFIPRVVSFRVGKTEWPAVPDVETALFNQQLERTL